MSSDPRRDWLRLAHEFRGISGGGMGQWWPCRVGATECSSACMGPFEQGLHYLQYLHHTLASGQITRREDSPTLQQKIGLKVTHQNRTQFPPKSVSPIRKLPILLHQRADRLKITNTENETIQLYGPQPCLTQWNYELCHVEPSKTDGSWWSMLTKRGPLEKEMANHISILALRTPWTVWKVF